MKKIFPFMLGAIVIITLIITMPKIFGGPEDKSEVFYNEGLTEGNNTTFIANPTEGLALVSSYFHKDRDLKQQAKESTIIVKGRVTEILGTVETKDFGAPIPEVQKQGGKKLHTDVLFRVDEYLGPNSLPFDELVIRHIGGKIEGFTHICEQEHLTIGEEVIIFRLSQHELLTQIPEGYNLEQYYLFNPASTFFNKGENRYRNCFNNESFDISKIKKAANQAPSN